MYLLTVGHRDFKTENPFGYLIKYIIFFLKKVTQMEYTVKEDIELALVSSL